VRLVDFFGCIGCNNAALSRELKANAHLFGYLFAERHVSLRLFEAEGKAVAYPIRENEVDNIWVEPLDGSRGRQITNFDSEQILNFPLVAGRKEPLHAPATAISKKERRNLRTVTCVRRTGTTGQKVTLMRLVRTVTLHLDSLHLKFISSAK